MYSFIIWNKVLVTQINVSSQQLYNTLGMDDMGLLKIQSIHTSLSNNNFILHYFKMQNHFRFWRKFNFEMHSREYSLFCTLLNFLYKLKAYMISRGSSESVSKLTVNPIKMNIGPNYTQKFLFLHTVNIFPLHRKSQ